MDKRIQDEGHPDAERGAAGGGPPRRALLLVNEHARHGKNVHARAKAILARAGFALVDVPCADGHALARCIRAHAHDVDLVIVGGGDGTLNAAAQALEDVKIPLGIIPLGTANDLARTLGIPSDIEAACAVIVSGHTRRIDLGWVNGRCYFNCASFGLSVDLTRRLKPGLKKAFGALAYVVAGLRVLWSARPFTVHLRGRDGHETRVRAVQVNIGNGRHFGGGLTIEENARIDDGTLDVFAITMRSAFEALPLVLALRSGRQNRWRGVLSRTGDTFEVRTRHPRSINTDGEIATQTPAVFKVLPGAVEVCVPAEEGAGAQDTRVQAAG